MTEPTTLSEAVARAICTERCSVYGEQSCYKAKDFKGCTDDESCEFMAQAAIRAVLEGVMEPGADALLASRAQFIADVEIYSPASLTMERAWQAMIRHIIECECGPAPSCKPQRRGVI